MPTNDLFAPRSEDAIKKTMMAAKREAAKLRNDESQLSLNYLENRQIEDVKRELAVRYPQLQKVKRGAQIQPIALPLTERVTAELCTTFNRPVTREVLNPKDEVDDEMTNSLNASLAQSAYDEKLHRVDQLLTVSKTCGIWYQAKRGRLRPVIVPLHDINPVAPNFGHMMDPADQDDYAGFVLPVVHDAQDASQASPVRWAFCTPAQVIFYEAPDPWSYSHGEAFDNPYEWRQVVDTDDSRGEEIDAPLQMFTVWNHQIPIDDVLLDSDADIARANRELNIVWSILIHLARTQGWGQMILKMANVGVPPATIAHGPQTPIVLQAGDDGQYISAPIDWAGLTGLINTLNRTLAISKRLSQSDVAVDIAAAQSGFAKLVESLPKLEARNERQIRLKHQEEQVAWPRIASILRYLGRPGFNKANLHEYKLRVRYSKLEFPCTPVEKAQELDMLIKYHLTTAAEEYARTRGVTLELANEQVLRNKARNMGQPDPDNETKTQDVVVDPTQTLNGAQVVALKDVLIAAAGGQIPRESAIEIIATGFPVTREQAEKILGNIGQGFVPEDPELKREQAKMEMQKQAAPATPAAAQEAPPQRTPDPPKRSRAESMLSKLIGSKE